MDKQFLYKYKEVQNWLNDNNCSILAFDTETDGLEFGAEIKGISLCNGQSACYVNFHNNPEIHIILDYIYQYLFKLRHLYYCKLLIGQNIPYDLRVLKTYGYSLDDVNLYDTMTAAHLLNENKSCGLKPLSVRVLKYKEEDVRKFKEVIEYGFGSRIFEEYAIGDAIKTWELYEKTKPLLTKQGFDKLFYEIEMPFQRVLVDLAYNGIEIDKEYLEDLEDTLTAEKITLEQKCIESIGMKMIEEKNLFDFVVISSPINLNSPDQLVKVIQERLKLKLPYTTDKGKPSTGAKSLEKLKGKHPFIDLLSQYKKVNKLLNTFVSPMWNFIDKDGRIRTSFNNCVARTGRLSSSKPNLQNLPKLSKDDLYKIRNLFIAKEGYKLICLDYSGQELRVCAEESQDKSMIDVFIKDKDLHLDIVNKWFNLGIPNEALYKKHKDYENYKTKFKDKRDKLKISFPILYGATAQGISIRTGVNEEKVQKGIDTFFKLYPKVREKIKQCRKELFERRYVRTLLGRKRRLNKITPKAIRQAFNFLIQGFCADLLRIAMADLRELCLINSYWDAKLVLTVHDSIVIEVKEEFAEICARHFKAIMETCIYDFYNMSVKLPVDIKIADKLL